MQDWRFDDLTRSLGKATSRRQVLKGLVGGVAAALVGRAVKPAAAQWPSHQSGGFGGFSGEAEVCNRQQCVETAFGLWKICESNCSNFSGRHGYNHQEDFACVLACHTAFQQERDDCLNNATGCFGGDACCDQHCVNTESDPQNCGACGHACQEGIACVDGACECPDDLTKCGEECVDLATNHEHCGYCETTCGVCETCTGGSCVPMECPDGYTCCQGSCVPLCPSGDAPDPQTCECNFCKGQNDGVACGENLVCCQEQCYSSQCPTGQAFSYDTCNCQCTATCPPGQLQDPETCDCNDLCANRNCDECHTCDPTSGDCVQVRDGTVCSIGTCCGGTCTEDGGSCCPEDAHRCYDQTGPVGPCCPSGQGCVAKVSDEPVFDDYTCCPLISGSGIGEDGRPYPALPDGTCCSGTNYWAVNCPGGWTCCDANNGSLCC